MSKPPMIYNTRAIVLRTVKYGETSLIVDMYTEQKGHQTFIVHSVRKAKASTPPSYLQLMSLVDMVAYHSDQKKIHHVKEIRLDHAYQSIPFDMRKTAVITCLAEITSKCLATSYAQPALFEFLHESLLQYDQPEPFDRDFLIRFLVDLSRHLGFGLEIQDEQIRGQYFDLMEGTMTEHRPAHDYVVDPSRIITLRQILSAPPGDSPEVPLETRRKLIDLLVLYYQLHVDTLREVQSLKILRELF